MKNKVMRPVPALLRYEKLMFRIRQRYDLIRQLEVPAAEDYVAAETLALHLRKVIEGIAFACLVACDQAKMDLPRQATGKWNAQEIFKTLKVKGLEPFPSPSNIRYATPSEKLELEVSHVIEGVPERRMTPSELIKVYQKTHSWLHEKNPYVPRDFENDNFIELKLSIARVWELIERHFISIFGRGFYCTLNDLNDGKVKLLELNKDDNWNSLAQTQ